MQFNVLEYLEQARNKKPDKTAYADDSTSLTFSQVYNKSRALGSALIHHEIYKEPIVVFMKKSPKTITAFYGVIYSGNYYVPIDEEMPKERVQLIFQKLKPGAVICDNTTLNLIASFSYEGLLLDCDTLMNYPVNDSMLSSIRAKAIDTDPVYIVFTSGSTGVPKGVVACHRSVIEYIENLSEVLKFNENTIFGNQAPLYVDACLKELYPTLKFTATTYLIPKSLFRFPVKLVEYLNDKKINTVCWVVSALTMISAFGALENVIPNHLHTIAFGSEVFPIKQFKLWKKALPHALFVNLYGPTEATGMSCYYIADQNFEEEDVIPIGAPFRNTEILLLDENNQPAGEGMAGEICIRGTAVTLGYYGEFDKTREAFVQNPLNKHYPELIYRTGDMGKLNHKGELVFLARRDNQIKHMGHRIELGEIENAVNNLDGIKSACCLFDHDKKRILLYYVGNVTTPTLLEGLKDKLPRYMLPNYLEALSEMPLTPNGKIDRVLLKEKGVRSNKNT